jgi:hypothetical protein
MREQIIYAVPILTCYFKENLDSQFMLFWHLAYQHQKPSGNETYYPPGIGYS